MKTLIQRKWGRGEGERGKIPHAASKVRLNRWLARISLFSLLAGFAIHASTLPADWQHVQQFTVTTPGLIKLSLPVETLDAARAALE
ncbi:MAG: hypothetical protein ACK2UQ_18190, partial [Anaerolineae bacterium]